MNNNLIDKSSDFSKISHLEVNTLKKKVEILQSENVLMKKQLENARRAKGTDAFALNIDSSERYQNMIDEYKNEIEYLKTQLNSARKQASQNESYKTIEELNKTIKEQKIKIDELKDDKMILQIKIDTLNRELSLKDNEIMELKEDNELGLKSDTVQHLRDANMRMTKEIGRLQDQLRKLESFNRSSMSSSRNQQTLI